jgi:predicted dinucleotide-binding enzyme
MNITIIGTGNVGKALGTSLAGAGHTVTFAARDAAKTGAVAAETGTFAAESLIGAVRAADVVVLAVPYTAAAGIAAEIAADTAGKVVIDATNPLKADYSGLATDGTTSGAEIIAAALPGARVVKAFNTMFAGIQANPAAHGTVIDALFATDDETARATIAALATSIGFRPVYVGPLAAARELEAMAWLNIRLQLLTGGSWQSSYVLVGAPEAAVAA